MLKTKILSSPYSIKDLENKVNKFLEENPQLELVSFNYQFSKESYNLVLWYKEPPKPERESSKIKFTNINECHLSKNRDGTYNYSLDIKCYNKDKGEYEDKQYAIFGTRIKGIVLEFEEN